MLITKLNHSDILQIKKMSKTVNRLFFFFFLVLLLSCTAKEEKMRPNFLFIVVDDLGWRDIGAFGSTFYESPHVDQLASEGVLFTNAYASSPVCSPSRASIMTGKYPATLNITDWIPGRQSYINTDNDQLLSQPFNLVLPHSETTIAEALKENGYQTFFAGKWHIGEDEAYWPHHQGFDTNIGGWAKGFPRGGYFSPYKNPMLEDGPDGEFLTDRLGDECLKFLAQRDSTKPFLLYLSFYTVHNPQEGKPEIIQRFKEKAEAMGLDKIDPFTIEQTWIKNSEQKGEWKDRLVQSSPVYASMVYSMDENIGKVINKLKALGLEKNTVIVFTSDNGGLSTAESSPTSNLPLRGGKGWLHEGGIRVPLIIKWPRKTHKGVIINAPTISTDFYPTLLEMAGIELLPEQHCDGKSLVPLLKGVDDYDREPLLWHYPHYSNQGDTPGSALRKGDYKLIRRYENNTYELYNLRKDISESNNLFNKEPAVATEMVKILEQYLVRTKAQMMYPNPDYKGIKRVNN